jgi:hypothetical protein
VPIQFDLWDLDVGAVCASDQILRRLSTVLDNLFGVASQEDLAYGLLVVQQLGVWKMPGRVEGLGECEMLLGNDTSGYALLTLACVRRGQAMPYRSQHRRHKLVCLLGLHQAAHFQHADGQARYHGGMLGQGFFQHLAVLLVVLQRPNLGHFSEALKSSQVRLVDVGKVRVCYHDVGQGLDVTQAVGKSAVLQRGLAWLLPVLSTSWGARVGSSSQSQSDATRSRSSQRRSADAG